METAVSKPPGNAWADAEPAVPSLQAELLRLIAEQARRVPVSLVLTSGMMALLVMRYVPVIYPVIWLAVVYVCTYFRTRLLLALPADAERSDDQKLALAARIFIINGVVLASLLAAFPFVPITMGAVISIYNFALCAATLHATAGYRRIYLPYTLVTLGPIGLVWAFTPGLLVSNFERILFVGLTLTYMLTMLGHAKGTYRLFSEAHQMRLQRLELNRQLREALVKAESANRSKTRFLASASHDLRQPIHALSLFSGSLAMRTLDARTATIAEQIDKAVTALASQLDALLDISKLDAGVIEKSISTVDLATVMAQLIDEFSPQAEQKGLRLVLEGGEGLLVRSDPMLLPRVLRNLLSNAVKYTDSGQVTVTVESSAGRCQIAIRDTGPGIPLEEQARVFEEFYQIRNPERDRSKGLGLGLAIVRRLVDMLEIHLQMDSQPGRGSCFSLTLPLAAPLLATALPAGNAAGSVSPLIQVLVVDDEEAIRHGMKTLLEEMGFSVRVADSTKAAMELARQYRPSVVLADFRLRGEDNGMQTIRALSALWPSLPALLISGDTAPERLRYAHVAGLKLLHKPVHPALLREAILQALET